MVKIIIFNDRYAIALNYFSNNEEGYGYMLSKATVSLNPKPVLNDLNYSEFSIFNCIKID